MTDRAHIQPLKGKHYGTIIQFDSGYDIENFSIRLYGDYSPSERQLTDWGMTLEEAKSDGIISDSLGHYETTLSYDAAKVIVDWLNKEQA